MGHELRADLFRTRLTGKYRWRLWKGSRIIDSSSQGYVEPGDRDDNLCEVTGAEMRLDYATGDLELQRPRFDGTVEVIPVRQKGDRDD